jgi:hypothetical protein
MNNLAHKSANTAKAWKWVQEHLEEFEKEVYGPPMISCSIKDPRYATAVESMLQRNDFLTITAQTTSDLKKLTDQLHGTLRLVDVSLKTADDNLQAKLQEAPLSPAGLQDAGMDGWAIDFIDGPLAVLCMLCDSQSLNKAAVTLADISENQYNFIVASELNKWTTATSSFKISKRREYGPSAVSTTTRSLYPASYWVDQPIDTSVRREIEERKRGAAEELEAMKTDNNSIKAELDGLTKQRTELEGDIVSIFLQAR